MQIFNTLSGQKDPLKNLDSEPIKLFVCGPTVYDYAHIGHARAYIIYDVLVRYLKSQGFKVGYLQNITDVDDKIIERAKRDGLNPKDLATQFEAEYRKDMEALGIESVSAYVRATESIDEIISQIKRLIEKGFAYETSSGVYFEVKKFNGYGKLSHQNLNELRSGSRVELDSEKKDSMDFALWKKTNEEPSWESPWGKGRPGWHIEDTAIAEKYFGLNYDIHGGGMDLKFPHHEAEIAQAEALTGQAPLAKIWMHTGFLLVDGQKMSKSLNNFITIRDFLKNYSPNVLRMMVLMNHYRSPFNYTEESAKQSEAALNTILRIIMKLDQAKRLIKTKNSSEPKNIPDTKEFYAAMNDDLNTPLAMVTIFENKQIISRLESGDITEKEILDISKNIKEKLEILGLNIDQPQIPEKIIELIKERSDLRATVTRANDLHKEFIRMKESDDGWEEKNLEFAQSEGLAMKTYQKLDSNRNSVEALGWEVQDSIIGSFVFPKDLRV